jgi:hypothetical protein
MPGDEPTPTPPDAADDAGQEAVEPEDTGGASSAAKPWDPKKIRITTKVFSLREVVEQVKSQEIDLAPDFQRDFVWKWKQRTRLIESILLGIPLPAFYFNQERDGTYQVVDGVQRLSTVTSFMENKHILSDEDLEYLHDLAGLTYAQLDPATVRRFRSTQIVVHVIEPQTPDDVKYDIFNRVNTLGSPLSGQEIRHAMSKQRSREFLRVLSEYESFDRATEKRFWRKPPDGSAGKVRDSDRMTNRELALRFCAFRDFSEPDYRKYASLDAYLIDFMRRLDQRSEMKPTLSESDEKKLAEDFDQAMVRAWQVLGKAAFRRWPPGQERRGPLNRAIFESQALALADFPLEDLLAKKEEVVAAFRSLFEDAKYARAVTVGTGDPAAIALRLGQTRDALKGVLG